MGNVAVTWSIAGKSGGHTDQWLTINPADIFHGAHRTLFVYISPPFFIFLFTLFSLRYFFFQIDNFCAAVEVKSSKIRSATCPNKILG